MKLLAQGSGPAIYDDGERFVIIGKIGSFKKLPSDVNLGWDEDFVTIPKSLLIKAAATLIAEASIE
jgi:hypothetical protein